MPLSPSVGVLVSVSPASDAWSAITARLSPRQYRDFSRFVDLTDPSVSVGDTDRLEALLMTWRLRFGESVRP